MIWDLRKSAQPVTELIHPNKIESPVKQISHSQFTNGSILVGFAKGDVVSYCSTTMESTWVIKKYLHNF